MENDKLRSMFKMALQGKPTLEFERVTVDAKYAKRPSWLWKLLPREHANAQYRRSVNLWELDYIVMSKAAFELFCKLQWISVVCRTHPISLKCTWHFAPGPDGGDA